MEGEEGRESEGAKGSVEEHRKRIPCTVFLDAEDVAFLQQYGAEVGLSFSSIIRIAVKEWIRKQKGR